MRFDGTLFSPSMLILLPPNLTFLYPNCSLESLLDVRLLQFVVTSVLWLQVLVPLSMQKKDMNASANKPKNGRPPRPQLSNADEGVFNIGSLSLPEGRVHGGGHMPSLSEGRVHGGGLMSALPEGRVHGGAIMALLNKEPSGGTSGRKDSFDLGLQANRTSSHSVWYPGYGHTGSGSCAVDNGLLRSELSLERSNSLGIDVGQFLASGVDLN